VTTPPRPEGRFALIVVDAQRGFDEPSWGDRNNPDCDTNIDRLVRSWAERRWPLVYVQHLSACPGSPLHPDRPGHRLKPYLRATPELLVTKQVNSAFHGDPDLHAWLSGAGVTDVAICGITTNHCCETTARVAGNLGYRVWFALDATHTFGRSGPGGVHLTADELTAATATNLHGEFATVTDTASLLGV
jgi:nicotinamidase-related amidase